MKLNDFEEKIIKICKKPTSPMEIFVKLNNAKRTAKKKTHAKTDGYSYSYINQELGKLFALGYLKKTGKSRNAHYETVKKEVATLEQPSAQSTDCAGKAE